MSADRPRRNRENAHEDTGRSPIPKRDYVARALRDAGRRRARFFDSYVTDLVTRDVQQISDIAKLDKALVRR